MKTNYTTLKNKCAKLLATLCLLTSTLNVSAQYCTTNLHNDSTTIGPIDSVKIIGTSFINRAVGITSNNGICYSKFPLLGSVKSLDTIQINTRHYYTIYLWVDFNQNNLFDSMEFIVPAHNTIEYNTFPIIVPSGSLLGQTTMRVRTADYIDYFDANDACVFLARAKPKITL